MEIIKLMYEHPFATFFFLVAVGWALGNFHPFLAKNTEIDNSTKTDNSVEDNHDE